MSEMKDQLCDNVKHPQSLNKEWILNELRLVQEAECGQSSLDRMAGAHWAYVASVLRAHCETEDVIKKCGHHYRTAFVHGWKHADEARKNGEL